MAWEFSYFREPTVFSKPVFSALSMLDYLTHTKSYEVDDILIS